MKQIKYIFGLFTLSFMILSFSNCGSAQSDKSIVFEKSVPFTISSIYSQDWIAGVQGGGSGTNLHLQIEEIEQGKAIDKVYFRNKMESAKQRQDNSGAYTAYFKSNKNRDVIMDNDPVNEAKNTPPDAFKFELEKNEAVISYKVKGTTLYYKISNIVEKPVLAYPSTNPKGID